MIHGSYIIENISSKSQERILLYVYFCHRSKVWTDTSIDRGTETHSTIPSTKVDVLLPSKSSTESYRENHDSQIQTGQRTSL